MPNRCRFLPIGLLAAALPLVMVRAGELPGPLAARIDQLTQSVLARTGVPSASIALVRDGGLVYARANGFAQLEPRRPASPQARYALGSISKEFTAAALLLLRQDGRIQLDEPVGRYVPDLGPAARVSLRQLLSHTSGIRDFWPQDYQIPEMTHPVRPQEILARWARQGPDFEPGTRWQYSNTGYTLAGLVAEHVAGEPLYAQLHRRLFEPLAMHTVIDLDATPPGPEDATGYLRHALGPLRPSAHEGRGWLFAAGSLAMTASDLARWDIAVMNQEVLQHASWDELTREVLLRNGAGTHYALGLDVELESGRRVLGHEGEIDGFTSAHRIYPEERIAVVVLTNQEAAEAAHVLARELSGLLLSSLPGVDAATQGSDRELFIALQKGRLGLDRLTANARFYFTPQALEDFHASLAPLGEPRSFELERTELRGGLLTRVYAVGFPGRTIRVVIRATPAGLIEQCTVAAE